MGRLLPTALSLGATAVLLAITTTPAPAEVPTCDGRPATIVSSAAKVAGTPGDDVIVSTAVHAEVDAGDGDDTVCALGAYTSVDAGSGDDLVDMSAVTTGYVYAQLGTGSDTYLGGSAHDEVYSQPGTGHDVISTGPNRDRVTVASRTADVSTGDGHDELDLRPGRLRGGHLDLGGSRDVVELAAPGAAVTVDLRHHRLGVGPARYTLTGAERATVSAQRTRLVGDGGRNVFWATACVARLSGGGGPDVLQTFRPSHAGVRAACRHPRASLFGGPGHDVLYGGWGHDLLVGGPGLDRASGGPGHTVCIAEQERHCDG